jgi:hypothetical protein
MAKARKLENKKPDVELVLTWEEACNLVEVLSNISTPTEDYIFQALCDVGATVLQGTWELDKGTLQEYVLKGKE